ncbi:MAG: histidine--tRNA ligase [Phycisphaerales bacterium]|jgi:histidyl-tRNA synthetase|nr:ATP phosphoribosyltransferase regulatory subunit [Planctomycetota bacterium]
MSKGRRFQAPRGTRDFYPPQMAVRRHIESAWRKASIDCGFEEIEGPTFEHLDLYTVKSGEGIVSELFSFTREGGEDVYALRPEFTPTLARMAAAKGRSLALPTKWFAIPIHYRAERPQRGRLREFLQWNVDVVGAEAPVGEVEVLEPGILALERLGLGPEDVEIRLSHRDAIAGLLKALGVVEDRVPAAFELLDRLDRLPPEEFSRRGEALGLDAEAIERLRGLGARRFDLADGPDAIARALDVEPKLLETLEPLRQALAERGLLEWCRFDPGIVRGLAYYRGIVFELHERGGGERAVAGGGRYDGLIALLDGPDLPACGMGMGDVVLSLVLQDRGLLGEDDGEGLMPAPDAFVIALDEVGAARLPALVAGLRRAGLHVRHSHRTTRNLGKLLGEANRCRARSAVLLDGGASRGVATVKNLASGAQQEIGLEDLAASLGT